VSFFGKRTCKLSIRFSLSDSWLPLGCPEDCAFRHAKPLGNRIEGSTLRPHLHLRNRQSHIRRSFSPCILRHSSQEGIMEIPPWMRRGEGAGCLECDPPKSGKCAHCHGNGQSLTGRPCIICHATGRCRSCDGTGDSSYSLVGFLPHWATRFFVRRKS
jgi:hypothetical protein